MEAGLSALSLQLKESAGALPLFPSPRRKLVQGSELGLCLLSLREHGPSHSPQSFKPLSFCLSRLLSEVGG